MHSRLNKPRYLLINPRYLDPMKIDNEKEISPTNGLYNITQPHLKQPLHWALRLIDLKHRPDIEKKAQDWIKNPNAVPRETISGWLSTDASPTAIKYHLEHQMVQETPDGRQMLLRYFDPRVLEQLIYILTQTQLNQIMGPITHWSYLDSLYGTNTIFRPTASAQQNMIQEEQWDSIQTIEEVEHIHLCLQRMHQSTIPSDNQYELVRKWIKISDSHNITDKTDRTAFILLGLELQWRFDQTYLFKKIFSRYNNTGTPLTNLIENISAVEWKNITQISSGEQ